MDNNSNQTFSQKATLIDPYLREDGLELMPVMIAESVVSTILNLFVLTVFIRMKKVTVSNAIFMMLSCSDLMLAFFVEPLFIVYRALEVWPLGEVMCNVLQITILAQFAISNLTILAMALRRYVQLAKPFLAKEKLDKTKLRIFGCMWVGTYLYVSLIVILFRKLNPTRTRVCEFEFPLSFVIGHDLVFCILPSFVAILFNIFNIYQLFKKSRSSPSSHPSLVVTKASLKKITGTSDQESCSSGASSSVSKCRCDCARAKRDLKAALCMLLIMLNLAITEYYFNIVWPLVTACPTCFSFLVFSWAIKALFFAPTGNAVILILFHDAFQKEAKKLFKAVFVYRKSKKPK